jgi:hypothetical protein
VACKRQLLALAAAGQPNLVPGALPDQRHAAPHTDKTGHMLAHLHNLQQQQQQKKKMKKKEEKRVVKLLWVCFLFFFNERTCSVSTKRATLPNVSAPSPSSVVRIRMRLARATSRTVACAPPTYVVRVSRLPRTARIIHFGPSIPCCVTSPHHAWFQKNGMSSRNCVAQSTALAHGKTHAKGKARV